MKYLVYFLIWLVSVVSYVITWIIVSFWNFNLRGVSYSRYIKWWIGNTYTNKRGRYIFPPCPFTHLKWMMKYGMESSDDIVITDYEN